MRGAGTSPHERSASDGLGCPEPWNGGLMARYRTDGEWRSPSSGLGAQLNHEGLDGQQRGRVGAQAAAALLDGSDPGQGLLGGRRAGGLVDSVGHVEGSLLYTSTSQRE